MKNQLRIGVIAIILILGGVAWYTSVSTSIMPDIYMGNQSGTSNLTKLPDGDIPLVKPTEVIELEDGDTFDLEATIVTQEVGNRMIKRLAYNGQIPGPVIKVQKGATATVTFTNNIDMETSLHGHGLRGAWQMDGAVPITPPVKIGETFSYQLEFPDAGVFWYHPHVREDYQQELGLYGNFIVEEDGYWNKVNQEAYLIIDDMLEDGEFSRAVTTNVLMGQFGNRLLINDQENYELTVTQGEITRAFITNVANTRTFDLTFTGAEMRLVGGDVGRIEQETMIKSQIIGTSERYVIELYYTQPGTYAIEHRGKNMGTVTVLPSATNRTAAFTTLRSNVADYADIRAQASELAVKTPDKSLRLDIEMNGVGDMQGMNSMMRSNTNESVNLMGIEMTRQQAVEHCEMMPGMAGCEPFVNTDAETTNEVAHGEDGIEWEDDMTMMNNMSTNEMMEWFIEDTNTGARGTDIDWSFKTGDLVKIRIYNDEKGEHPMQHPIHFHGQKFVVLATDGVINDNFQWKDTTLIPTGRTVDLLVDMSNPGNWMAHCHIAEHLEAGMMFQFDVK